MNSWYVLWVLSGSEERLLSKVRRVPGIEVAFAPRGQKWLRKDGQWHATEAYYFPGYLFLRCAMQSDIYYRLRQMSGVIGWLGMDTNFPTHVPDEEMVPVLALHNGSLDGLTLSYDKRQRRASGEVLLLGKPHKVTVAFTPFGSETLPPAQPPPATAPEGADGMERVEGAPSPIGSERDRDKQPEADGVDASPDDTEGEHSSGSTLDS